MEFFAQRSALAGGSFILAPISSPTRNISAEIFALVPFLALASVQSRKLKIFVVFGISAA